MVGGVKIQGRQLFYDWCSQVKCRKNYNAVIPECGYKGNIYLSYSKIINKTDACTKNHGNWLIHQLASMIYMIRMDGTGGDLLFYS